MGRTAGAALVIAALLIAADLPSRAADPAGAPDWDRIKREWSRMSPEDRAHWGRLRDDAARRAGASRPALGKTPGETCTQAQFEIGALPFFEANTTEGSVDQLWLSGAGVCAGGGTQETATGIGPDLVYKIEVDIDCDLRVTMSPAVVDLALYVVTTCTSLAGSCLRVSDGGASGQPEQIDFSATAGVDYFVVVDGYFGTSGAYTLGIVENGSAGCSLVPVELMEFSVE